MLRPKSGGRGSKFTALQKRALLAEIRKTPGNNRTNLEHVKRTVPPLGGARRATRRKGSR